MTLALVLAVDGGQTSSRAALCTLDGNCLKVLSGGPWGLLTNAALYQTSHDSAFALLSEVRQALTVLNVPLTALIRAFFGLTGGVDGQEHVKEWVHAFFPHAEVEVVEDVLSNYRGANPAGGPGILVIAGGGSVAWGWTAEGQEAQAGSFGYLLGDVGSAYDLARRGVVAALAGLQRLGPVTTLTERLSQHFQIADPWDLRMACYDGRISRDQLSRSLPVIGQAAQDGDQVSLTLLQQGGRGLALLALTVARRLNLTHGPVFPTGGVFHDPTVRTSFLTHLAASGPELRGVAPHLQPLGGCALLGLEPLVHPANLPRITANLAATGLLHPLARPELWRP